MPLQFEPISDADFAHALRFVTATVLETLQAKEKEAESSALTDKAFDKFMATGLAWASAISVINEGIEEAISEATIVDISVKESLRKAVRILLIKKSLPYIEKALDLLHGELISENQKRIDGRSGQYTYFSQFRHSYLFLELRHYMGLCYLLDNKAGVHKGSDNLKQIVNKINEAARNESSAAYILLEAALQGTKTDWSGVRYITLTEHLTRDYVYIALLALYKEFKQAYSNKQRLFCRQEYEVLDSLIDLCCFTIKASAKKPSSVLADEKVLIAMKRDLISIKRGLLGGKALLANYSRSDKPYSFIAEQPRVPYNLQGLAYYRKSILKLKCCFSLGAVGISTIPVINL